jgi:hypothetical protein
MYSEMEYPEWLPLLLSQMFPDTGPKLQQIYPMS